MPMRTSPLPYSRAKRLEPLLQRELSESIRKLLAHADLPNTFTLTKIEVRESLSVARVATRLKSLRSSIRPHRNKAPNQERSRKNKLVEEVPPTHAPKELR